jgi:hypothetical protein
MNEIMIGGIATASLVAALFFLRFWRSTGDRFFLLFALSFFIEGANRVVLYLSVGPNEAEPMYYAVRLVAYGLILFAIIDKNRSARAPRSDENRRAS